MVHNAETGVHGWHITRNSPHEHPRCPSIHGRTTHIARTVVNGWLQPRHASLIGGDRRSRSGSLVSRFAVAARWPGDPLPVRGPLMTGTKRGKVISGVLTSQRLGQRSHTMTATSIEPDSRAVSGARCSMCCSACLRHPERMARASGRNRGADGRATCTERWRVTNSYAGGCATCIERWR